MLYAGLMLTADGPKVIEYNVRFGDPECQVVVPRLASDLGELCAAATRGAALPPLTFADDACVTVVLASGGYPSAPRRASPSTGSTTLAGRPDVVVFHAGTARAADGSARHRRRPGARRHRLGARRSPTRGTAAYEAAATISWPGVQYRRDIAAARVSALPAAPTWPRGAARPGAPADPGGDEAHIDATRRLAATARVGTRHSVQNG